jgi:hypothetical protein
VDLKLGHYNKDGIEVIDVEGKIDIYTPRLRELLIDLVSKNTYQLIVNMEKVEFLDSTGLGVLVVGPEAGAGARRLAGPGLHPGADTEHLPDHRADEGLRHPPDSGPGHRGQVTRPVAVSPAQVAAQSSSCSPRRCPGASCATSAGR